MLDSKKVVSYDLCNGAVLLQFEPYSFTDSQTGRTVEGFTMFLAFPWGKVRLTANGHKSDEILSMLEYVSGIRDKK